MKVPAIEWGSWRFAPRTSFGMCLDPTFPTRASTTAWKACGNGCAGLEDAFEGLLWECEEITDLAQNRVRRAREGNGQFSQIGIDDRFA